MTPQEKKQAIISEMTTEQLVEAFELTNGKHDEEIPIVRGWILDELEVRNPQAIDAFLDSSNDSPREFYMVTA